MRVVELLLQELQKTGCKSSWKLYWKISKKITKKMTFDISKITIPTNPGIYLMKDSDGKIIYIGKAKNLKKRVKSYFLKNQNYKTQKLVENISDIEFVLTDNESEAFLLESNMIKKYRPRFNIELKDQQRYTYLRISDEKYPRLLVARRTRDGKFLVKENFWSLYSRKFQNCLQLVHYVKHFKLEFVKLAKKSLSWNIIWEIVRVLVNLKMLRIDIQNMLLH